MMRTRFAGWLLGAVVAAGCGSGSGGTADVCPNDLPASCPSSVPSYAKTIAPALMAKCVFCHEPGGPSVHSLQTYADVYALRGSVLDQVYASKMPQAGSPPLTSDERAALLAWLVCEAPNN
jgi:hypothetical protein